MELEALEAILADDLQDFDGTRPDGWDPNAVIRTVAIRPAEDAAVASGELPLLAELLWAHTPSYPDEPPLVKARSEKGLSDADVAELQAAVDAAVQENMGMAMIYGLVTAAQEWLTDKAAQGAEAPPLDPVAARKAAEEAEERRLAEIRSHGTPVTPETFAPWKERFYAELAAARARADEAGKQKLTGKQYFLQMDGRARDEADGQRFVDISDEDIDYSDDDDDEDLLDELEREVVATAG